MSCNGCRVLRKGCSENCILRPCLQWIESPESQGHATIFVAKFFGRAGLMSFISAVPESQRPALFQSLLFEAAGRTVNPVNGAVELLWTGNWHVCQAAVETVFRGGTLRPMQEIPQPASNSDDSSEVENACKLPGPKYHYRFTTSRSRAWPKRKKTSPPIELDLRLSPGFVPAVNLRPGTPSMNSEEESVTTTLNNNNYNNFVSCYESRMLPDPYGSGSDGEVLNLFV